MVDYLACFRHFPVSISGNECRYLSPLRREHFLLLSTSGMTKTAGRRQPAPPNLDKFWIHYHEVYEGGHKLRTAFLQGMPIHRTRYLSHCGFPFARSFRASWTSFLTRQFLKMRCSRWQTTSFLIGLNFRKVAYLSLTINRKCIYTYPVIILPVTLPTSFAGLLPDSRTKAQPYKSHQFERLDPLYRRCPASKRTRLPTTAAERLNI